MEDTKKISVDLGALTAVTNALNVLHTAFPMIAFQWVEIGSSPAKTYVIEGQIKTDISKGRFAAVRFYARMRVTAHRADDESLVWSIEEDSAEPVLMRSEALVDIMRTMFRSLYPSMDGFMLGLTATGRKRGTFKGATYNQNTILPPGIDPVAEGMIFEGSLTEDKITDSMRVNYNLQARSLIDRVNDALNRHTESSGYGEFFIDLRDCALRAEDTFIVWYRLRLLGGRAKTDEDTKIWNEVCEIFRSSETEYNDLPLDSGDDDDPKQWEDGPLHITEIGWKLRKHAASLLGGYFKEPPDVIEQLKEKNMVIWIDDGCTTLKFAHPIKGAKSTRIIFHSGRLYFYKKHKGSNTLTMERL